MGLMNKTKTAESSGRTAQKPELTEDERRLYEGIQSFPTRSWLGSEEEKEFLSLIIRAYDAGRQATSNSNLPAMLDELEAKYL